MTQQVLNQYVEEAYNRLLELENSSKLEVTEKDSTFELSSIFSNRAIARPSQLQNTKEIITELEEKVATATTSEERKQLQAELDIERKGLEILEAKTVENKLKAYDEACIMNEKLSAGLTGFVYATTITKHEADKIRIAFVCEEISTNPELLSQLGTLTTDEEKLNFIKEHAVVDAVTESSMSPENPELQFLYKNEPTK